MMETKGQSAAYMICAFGCSIIYDLEACDCCADDDACSNNDSCEQGSGFIQTRSVEHVSCSLAFNNALELC